jgi:hypothetical protein
MKPMSVPGIHHVTAISGDAQRTLDFYGGVLGLRLLKLTVATPPSGQATSANRPRSCCCTAQTAESAIRSLWASCSRPTPRCSVRAAKCQSTGTRVFRRLAEGVFGLDDLRFRTDELADFVAAAAQLYGLAPSRTIAVGYSQAAGRSYVPPALGRVRSGASRRSRRPRLAPARRADSSSRPSRRESQD